MESLECVEGGWMDDAEKGVEKIARQLEDERARARLLDTLEGALGAIFESLTPEQRAKLLAKKK